MRHKKTKPDGKYGCEVHKCGLDIISDMDCPYCLMEENNAVHDAEMLLRAILGEDTGISPTMKNIENTVRRMNGERP